MPPGIPSSAPLTSAAAAGADALKSMTTVLKDLGAFVTATIPPLKLFGDVMGTIGNKLKDMGKAVASAFGSMASKVGEWLGPLGKAINGYLGGLGGAAATALSSFGKSLGSLALVGGVATAAIVGIGLALGSFVSKANPAVWEQFLLSVADLQAVIGRALVPLFQTVFIPLVRLAGDVLMGLAPIGAALAQAMKPLVQVFGVVGEIVGRALGKIGEVAMALAPALQAIGMVFVELAKAVQPVYDLLIDLIGGAFVEAANLLAEAVKAAMPVVLALAEIISDFVRSVMNTVRQLLSFIGINLPDTPGVKPGSSVGAATRSAQHSGVEDVIKQAQRAAYSLGIVSKGDPMAKMVDISGAMKNDVAEMKAFILNLPEKMWLAFLKMPAEIAKAFVELRSKAESFITGQPDVSLGTAAREAARDLPGGNLAIAAADFGRGLVLNQLAKPGVLGYTTLNPF